MRRLLQGDVGSGKTIVAFEAAIIAIENGYQVALMAPTEILAQQHYFSARRHSGECGVSHRPADRLARSRPQARRSRRHIAQGNAQLVIGTHALLEEKVEFANLGLVIVDEQHRFGVLQRLKLMRKSGDGGEPTELRTAGRTNTSVRQPSRLLLAEPDVLVMTATPIPRTLGADSLWRSRLSVLDELAARAARPS